MSMNKNLPIAVIDSGLGGLTVYKELKKLLPHEQFLFVGDNLHAPYGPKSAEELKRYFWEILTFLEKKLVKIVVVACHTLSTLIHEESGFAKALKCFSFPIIGMVEASVEAVIESNRKKCIVLGTLKTIQSNVYSKALADVHGFSSFGVAAPQLASSIEKNLYQLNLTEIVLQEIFNGPSLESVDCLLLACTHYPIVKEMIEKKLPKTVTVIDPSLHVAKKVFHFLNFRNLLADCFQKNDRFFLSKEDSDFVKKMEAILAKEIFVDFIPNQLK